MFKTKVIKKILVPWWMKSYQSWQHSGITSYSFVLPSVPPQNSIYKTYCPIIPKAPELLKKFVSFVQFLLPICSPGCNLTLNQNLMIWWLAVCHVKQQKKSCDVGCFGITLFHWLYYLKVGMLQRWPVNLHISLTLALSYKSGHPLSRPMNCFSTQKWKMLCNPKLK